MAHRKASRCKTFGQLAEAHQTVANWKAGSRMKSREAKVDPNIPFLGISLSCAQCLLDQLPDTFSQRRRILACFQMGLDAKLPAQYPPSASDIHQLESSTLATSYNRKGLIRFEIVMHSPTHGLSVGIALVPRFAYHLRAQTSPLHEAPLRPSLGTDTHVRIHA